MTELWDDRALEERCARFRRAKLALDRGATDEELQALDQQDHESVRLSPA